MVKTGASTKTSAVKAAKKSSGKELKEGETVFVVASHFHFDDYKRADSASNVVAVYRNIVTARKLCIVKNLENNYDIKLPTFSKTLYDLLNEDDDKEGKCGDDDHSEEEEEEFQMDEDIKITIESLSDASVVEKIYNELLAAFGEVEAEYTMHPSQTLFTVHKSIISNED